MEIQAEEGGDDAKQFAGELAAAYAAHWRHRPLNETALSFGYASFLVDAVQADWFRMEIGLHCVQRVPRTERDGRRHTSLARVTMRPLVPNAPPLRLEDVEIITQRGHGNGGQHQNKTSSAVRARHRPTGISVMINGRSQLLNRDTALKILAGRVAEHFRDRVAAAALSAKHHPAIPQGKIRTYNLKRNQVTDHRTGACSFAAARLLKGDFSLIRGAA